MRHSTPSSLLLTCFLLLTACEPTLATRGNLLDQDRLALIAIGSTREDVAAKLGSPTFTGSFEDSVWYYVGRKTEQTSFFDPEVKQQKAVSVHFGDDGRVTAIHELDSQLATDIKPVDRVTPTYGQDNTFIQQLLGNLSRPMPAKSKNRQ